MRVGAATVGGGVNTANLFLASGTYLVCDVLARLLPSSLSSRIGVAIIYFILLLQFALTVSRCSCSLPQQVFIIRLSWLDVIPCYYVRHSQGMN